jgi:hypothetical protein
MNAHKMGQVDLRAEAQRLRALGEVEPSTAGLEALRQALKVKWVGLQVVAIRSLVRWIARARSEQRRRQLWDPAPDEREWFTAIGDWLERLGWMSDRNYLWCDMPMFVARLLKEQVGDDACVDMYLHNDYPQRKFLHMVSRDVAHERLRAALVASDRLTRARAQSGTPMITPWRGDRERGARK